MNNLTIFNFNNTPIRTSYQKNQIWFCLIDVCGVLEIGDRAQLRKRLNERGMCLIPTPSKGGEQKTYYINEPNLYRALLRSDKPVAREFENWICEKVVPSIRLTGVYACGEVSVKEHMRSKPSGKKEIVLSEKAKAEIGGIVKAVVKAELNEPVEDTLTARKNASACGVTGISEQDKRSLAELVAAKVSANLMYLQRDELATRARALRQQAEVYDESVREYDRNLAQIEKALASGL